MNNDIAVRLRAHSVSHYPTRYGACMEEAADEIERLRTLLERIREACRRVNHPLAVQFIACPYCNDISEILGE